MCDGHSIRSAPGDREFVLHADSPVVITPLIAIFSDCVGAGVLRTGVLRGVSFEGVTRTGVTRVTWAARHSGKWLLWDAGTVGVGAAGSRPA